MLARELLRTPGSSNGQPAGAARAAAATAAASSPGKLRSAPQGRVMSHQLVLAWPRTAQYPLPVEALPRRHSVRRGEASRVLVRDFW